MWGIEVTPEHPVPYSVEVGRRAEANGFDTVFVSGHYNNRDQFITLDRIAAATDGVRLGPGVANPYETHPVSLASRMATLDEVSGGRTVFGISAGDKSTLANLGIDWEHPVRRVVETIQVVRPLWTGERVNHEGTFTATDAGLNYSVGSIPIYVGAQGPDMLRMSSMYSDGVLINASHPRDFEWASDVIAAGLTKRDDDRGPFDLAAYGSVSIAETTEAAREAARPPVAFIAGGAAVPVLDRHGIDREVATRISALIGTGQFHKAFQAVTDRMIDAFAIAGTPEQVTSRVRALLKFVDSVVFGSPLGPDPQVAVGLLGEVVRDISFGS